MKNFLEIFNAIAPTLVAVLVVYITYRYGIKHKRFEAKEEYNKRLRTSISNLMLIWKELSEVQKFLKDPDPSNELIAHIPQIAKQYLKIDSEKIKQLKASYDTSLNELKDIDVILYFKLVDLLNPFKRAVEEVLMPILNDSYFNKSQKHKFIIPLIDNIIEELETEIKTIGTYLPKREAKQLNSLIEKHNSSLSTETKSQLPTFLVNFINSKLKTKEPITNDDIVMFYNNPTIIWMLKKIFRSNKGMLSKFTSPIIFFKFLTAFGKNDSKTMKELIGKYTDDEILRKLTITQEEEKLHFIGNKTIFRIILGITLKTKGDIPFSVKRTATHLYRGDLSFRKELEIYQMTLETETMTR